MIKYSVIIPHYQDLDNLHKLLDSIPNRSDIEVLVIDDKSLLSENECEILKARCSFFENKTKIKSAGTCRNIGLEHAVGDWLVFADSDDLFPENAFNHFDLFNTNQFELVFFNVTSLNSSTHKKSDRHTAINRLVKDYSVNNSEEILYYHVVPWGKLISRTLVAEHNIKFDEVVASNDVMFSLKTALAASKIKASELLGYIVVRREGSLTKTTSVVNMKSRLNVILERNSMLIELGKKQYQISFLSILFQYRNALSICVVFNLLMGVILLKQRFLPRLKSLNSLKRIVQKTIRQEF